MKPIETRTYDRLIVEIYPTKDDAGKAAAQRAAKSINQVAPAKERVNLLFSTGASQFDFVRHLQTETDVPWDRCIGFHLDEYPAMAPTHSASFRLWLKTRVEDPLGVPFHYIQGDAADIPAECTRYATLLKENPIDLAFIGIGENGHIAFNDPPVADFSAKEWVKVLELDEICRRQQWGEGWFSTLDDVPRHGISLTIPAIMASKSILSVVPEARKAGAVKNALEGPIDTSCPASILRRHADATLYLDVDSAAKLAPQNSREAVSHS